MIKTQPVLGLVFDSRDYGSIIAEMAALLPMLYYLGSLGEPTTNRKTLFTVIVPKKPRQV
jgi:hypothetical protein